MDWIDERARGPRLRLGYGLNLHAPRTLAELERGLCDVTLPLARRLRLDAREPFGAGFYLPAELAVALADPAHARELARLTALVRDEALAPFTFNAFPYGGFQTDGLKERVFAPAWDDPARLDYTLAVARVAAELARAAGISFVSLSTHTGAFGPIGGGNAAGSGAELRGAPDDDRGGARAAARGDARELAHGAARGRERDEGRGDLGGASARELAVIAGFARAAAGLAELRDATGVWIALALEPEPRASSGDQRELTRWAPRLLEFGARALQRELGFAEERAAAIVRAHLARCVDACHAAVEFEDEAALDGLDVLPCAKLQFTSALALRDPGRSVSGRAILLGLDEPRYLHQVTGRSSAGLVRARDLGEVAEASRRGDPRWLSCDEWRCHFHVPVDLERAPGELATTRDVADRLLARILERAAAWPYPEIHVEIETYTWDVLPGAVRGPGALVDALEREYAHVLRELTRHGFRRAAEASRPPRGEG